MSDGGRCFYCRKPHCECPDPAERVGPKDALIAQMAEALEAAWIHGMPSPEQVANHEQAHNAGIHLSPIAHRISVAREGKPGGEYVAVPADSYGNWLCVHPEDGPFGSHVGISRLRAVSGEVLLANGFSFWQPLAQTNWAAKSRWLPVNREGLPVILSSDAAQKALAEREELLRDRRRLDYFYRLLCGLDVQNVRFPQDCTPDEFRAEIDRAMCEGGR
jgi:hypothetical protein